jgi:hypothetical protein
MILLPFLRREIVITKVPALVILHLAQESCSYHARRSYIAPTVSALRFATMLVVTYGFASLPAESRQEDSLFARQL